MSSIGILENPLSCYSSESAGCLYSNSRQVVNVSAETTSIISHTDNSGKGRVLLLPNCQSTYTTPNSLAAVDIIKKNNFQCFDRSFNENPYFYGYPTT